MPEMFKIKFLFLSLFLLTPFIGFAQGLIPCNGPDCSICDLLVLINNIYLFVMTWSPIVAVLRIGYAGIQMIINGSNSTKVGEARKSIQDTLLWLVIIYCSFLIVNVVIHLVPVKEELKGSWYKFTCESKDPGLGGTGLKKGAVVTVTLQQQQGNQGGGTQPSSRDVTAPSSGMCTDRNFLRNSFGSAFQQHFKRQIGENDLRTLSCVCQGEDSGSLTVVNQETYAAGPFQLNLSAQCPNYKNEEYLKKCVQQFGIEITGFGNRYYKGARDITIRITDMNKYMNKIAGLFAGGGYGPWRAYPDNNCGNTYANPKYNLH